MTEEFINQAFDFVDKNAVKAIKAMLAEYPEIANSENIYGSLLMEAVNEGNKEIVQLLIKNGADVNYIGGLSETSILADAAQNGNLEIVKLLVEANVNLNSKTFASNALFAAIYKGHVEVAEFLIDHGIDILAKYDIGDIDGCDALEYARQYGRTEIYEYLKGKMKK